jgi:hypothetical protein
MVRDTPAQSDRRGRAAASPANTVRRSRVQPLIHEVLRRRFELVARQRRVVDLPCEFADPAVEVRIRAAARCTPDEDVCAKLEVGSLETDAICSAPVSLTTINGRLKPS